MYKCYITFDVDMLINYKGKIKFVDEFEYCFAGIKNVLEKFPDIKTTWFLRIDSNMEKIYGRADYLLFKYASYINWLKENGHELAWHCHPYIYLNNRWIQNTDEDSVVKELINYSKIAKAYDIRDSVRIGWGFQTTKIMKTLNDLGYKVDSSAIPRPKYKWSNQHVDWASTPQKPYNPSILDYRKSGDRNMTILEVPMTTTIIRASYDEEQDIYRYINPAYKNEIFKISIDKVDDDCVLIAHPSEFNSKWNCGHELIGYSYKELYLNLQYLNNKFEFRTINHTISKQ